MGCVARVTRALEESDGIASATFDSDSETFLVSAERGFRMDDAAGQVLRAGRAHDEELGLDGTPDWVLKTTAPTPGATTP